MAHRSARRIGVLVVVLGLAAAGCLPGGGEEPAEDQAAGGGTPAEEPERLVVWDIYVRGVEREVADRLAADFEAEHGVEVVREPKTLDDLKTTLPLAMGQADGPDVASVNQGRADMGAMVQAGLLLDLTEFGRERGWYETWGENLLQRSMFTADGETFGEGNLYGVAPQAELVGWFYDTDVFAEHGLEPPETFEQLESLLAELKQAGETPIVFGNLDAWPAIHTYGAVEHTEVDTAYLDDLIFGRGDVRFDVPGNVEAAEVVQRWADEGYFSDNFSGIGYDDSLARFSAGEGAMMLTGTWIAGELEEPDRFGFFLTPGHEAGELPPQTGGMGVPLGVRATTDAPRLAQEYVDFMTSQQAAEAWVEAWLPTRPPTDVAEGALMGDLVSSWEQVLDRDQLGHYLDWATPTFYDALTAELQRLLAAQTEPEAFVEALQADYASAR